MKVSLDEAINLIEDKVEELLNLEKVEGGLLQEVTEISIDYKVKNKPKPPAVFITFGEAINTQSHSIREYWTLPVHIIAVTKNNDIKEGRRQATQLTARARSILLKCRNLGLEFVMDIQSRSYSKEATEYETTTGLYYASEVTINVLFWILED